jgi:hypothetical protein
MEKQLLQIENVTKQEFLQDVEKVIGKLTSSVKIPAQIRVLDRSSASRILDISPAFFDKLQMRGCIPATVHAGTVKQTGKPKMMWCEHHLQLIKPVTDRLKYEQNDGEWLKAAKEIRKILGL